MKVNLQILLNFAYDDPVEEGPSNNSAQNLVIAEGSATTSNVPERVNISRREFRLLAKVLERNPQSLLFGGEDDQGESQVIPVTVTGNDEETQEEAMPESLDQVAPILHEAGSNPISGGNSGGQGKRQRPRYSLRTHMFR